MRYELLILRCSTVLAFQSSTKRNSVRDVRDNKVVTLICPHVRTRYKFTCCRGGVSRSVNSATFSSRSGFVMTLKQCLRTEKLVASLSQSESELADMEWWDGEKKPPEPKGNDSSELPA